MLAPLLSYGPCRLGLFSSFFARTVKEASSAPELPMCKKHLSSMHGGVRRSRGRVDSYHINESGRSLPWALGIRGRDVGLSSAARSLVLDLYRIGARGGGM